MIALYTLAEKIEHYKTNLIGGHFTFKPTSQLPPNGIAQSSEKHYKNIY